MKVQNQKRKGKLNRGGKGKRTRKEITMAACEKQQKKTTTTIKENKLVARKRRKRAVK